VSLEFFHYTRFATAAGIGCISKERRSKYFGKYKDHAQNECVNAIDDAVNDEIAFGKLKFSLTNACMGLTYFSISNDGTFCSNKQSLVYIYQICYCSRHWVFFKRKTIGKYKDHAQNERVNSIDNAVNDERASYEELNGINIMTDARHGWRKNSSMVNSVIY
jgi:hypothetical protein